MAIDPDKERPGPARDRRRGVVWTVVGAGGVALLIYVAVLMEWIAR